jgi:hypothetical protein
VRVTDPLNPKQYLSDALRRNRERQDELDLERQKAEIRAQSYALVWTGTAEELTGNIKRWFESGCIVAESLEDALQIASIHFRRPDGMPVIGPLVSMNKQEYSTVFSPSPTYQKIIFRGKEYDLSGHTHAPHILKVLHESLNSGELGMTTLQIRAKAKLPHNGKMYDWFKSTGLWKNLVVRVGKDQYRLDIEP